MRDPRLMWSPWMSSNYHLLRSHIVSENITIREIILMHDALKGD